VTPSEVSAREDFGRRSPGLLLSATGGDGRGDGGTRDCEEGKNSKLETGNFGDKSEKKEAHAMREMEEETTTGRREFVRFREPVLEHDSVDLLLGPC